MCSSCRDDILQPEARWTTIDNLGRTVTDIDKDSPSVGSYFHAKYRRIVIGHMLVACVIVG